MRAPWAKVWNHERARLLKRWSVCVAAAVLGTGLLAAGVEEILERKAAARLTAGETFANVNGARIRYLSLGKQHAGKTIVLLPGLGSNIEQMRYVQPRLAAKVPTLSYDRAGYGFSTGSNAHTADAQAAELMALLETLEVAGPVVLVGYSSSALLARVFAGRYPTRTAGVFLVEPDLPEFDEQVPGQQGPRRIYARWVFNELFASTLGLSRLFGEHGAHAGGPRSEIDEREEESLQRRRHFWALAREVYELPTSFEQAKQAPVPSEPLVILSTEQSNPLAARLDELYAELAHRSPRGKVIKLPNYDHGRLFAPGPVLDAIAWGVEEIATGTPPPRSGVEHH
ncbi:MAG TPA: alpha/beta hydrolase [Polyangiaceae bacterium]|nr:alpha/beta hydrolase [Polyangiaceae bacterium]